MSGESPKAPVSGATPAEPAKAPAVQPAPVKPASSVAVQPSVPIPAKPVQVIATPAAVVPAKPVQVAATPAPSPPNQAPTAPVPVPLKAAAAPTPPTTAVTLPLSSLQLAQEANALNSGLDAIEQGLANDPAKMPQVMAFDGNPVKTINFDRFDGESWYFIVLFKSTGPEDERRRLSNMSLVQKAAFGNVLPAFVESYRAEQKRRLALVQEANASVLAARKILEGA